VACDAAGAIVAWNVAAERLFGRDGFRAGGAHVKTLLPEWQRAAVEEHITRCLTQGEPTEFRTRLGGTEDEPLEYACYVTPVLEADGSPRGVAVWFRDISARVRLQRALRKQERLTSLGGMSGAVAHHYNNLIQGISCNIDYAKRQRTLASMLRALEQTGEPLGRAAEITQQLLIFAQADHRWNDTADLTETFLQFGDEQEKRLAQKNIRLNLDWQKIPVTAIYRDHLLIILTNLTKNAIEAMPEGGTITMTLARRDEHSVQLTVTDTGRGIGPETMERIFEPFCTSKSELAGGEGRNTGLGLAVAHGLVAEMHGTIHADNVPGRGARFDIVLPLETDDA
jgi:PAS domain S-box-containing protein